MWQEEGVSSTGSRSYVGLLAGIIVAVYAAYLATFYAQVAEYDVQTAHVHLLLICVLLDRLMARVNQSVEGSKTWIGDEKYLHETRDYGANQKAVGEALVEQRMRVAAIDEFGNTLNDVTSRTQDEKKVHDLSDSYSELKFVAANRLECLETLSKVDSLEGAVNVLSSEFGRTATSLSQNGGHSDPLTDEDAQTQASWDGVPRLSQRSILALKKNWQHLQLMLKLADAHLANASAYHQFHHDAGQYQRWLLVDCARLAQLSSQFSPADDRLVTPDDTLKALNDLKEVATTLVQWQKRLDDLVERSKKVVPVHQRVEPVDRYLPITAMCDYTTKDIKVQESEELKLIDNSNTEIWKVQNMQGSTATLPSITCLVPGPDSFALRKAASLKSQFAKAYTDELKRLGKNLIDELNALLQDWLKDDAKKIRALSPKDKKAVGALLDAIEDTLGKHWTKHPGYQRLQDNIGKVRQALNDPDDQHNQNDHDAKTASDAVKNTSNANDSVNIYKDLLNDWDALKAAAGLLPLDDELLASLNLVDDVNNLDDDADNKSEQKSDVINQRKLGGTQHGALGEDNIDGGEAVEELVKTDVAGGTENAVESTVADTEYDEAGVEEELVTYEETMETEELVHSEQEEKRTFVITGVMDTLTGGELSMADAVEAGVIIAEEGMFVDRQSGDKIPIAEAMSRGLIKVEFSMAKKSEEKRRDVGLITVTTRREARPVTIKGAVEPGTGRRLTLQEAQERAIIDLKRQCYHNPDTGADTPLADAIASGLIFAEDSENGESEARVEAEVVSKTFAVYSVVDQRKKNRLPFSEAVKLQLLDKETGTYWHNVTGEKIAFAEAMQKGFIKAAEVADPSSMDIAMENTAVAERVDTVRKKLLKPMSALGAMSKMAAANKKK